MCCWRGAAVELFLVLSVLPFLAWARLPPPLARPGFATTASAGQKAQEPVAGSAAMFSREISDPGLWQNHPGRLEKKNCEMLAKKQISPHRGGPYKYSNGYHNKDTYPPSLMSADATWGGRECLADWMAQKFGFVLVVRGWDKRYDLTHNMAEVLFKLIGTAEMRLVNVYVVCFEKQSLVTELERNLTRIRTQVPKSAQSFILANVHVVDTNGAPVDWHGHANALMDFVQKLAAIDFAIVLPVLQPLPFTFRAYTFAVAFAGDEAGMVAWMGKVLRPLESLSATVPYMLGKAFPEGTVLPLGGWGAEPNEPPAPTQRVRVVPRHSRWFAKEKVFQVPYLREGCKILMYAANMCKKNNASDVRGEGYVWGCDEMNPLTHFNHTAYMKGDCASSYVAEKVTIVITEHMLPTAPSTLLMRVLIQSLHMMPELRQARILILYDGVNMKNAANPRHPGEWMQAHTSLDKRVARALKHIANIKALLANNPLFANAELHVMNSTIHLLGQMKYAVKLVQTPFMFVVQPDLPFLRPGEFYYLLRTMEINPGIKHVRFNRRNNIPVNWDAGMDHSVPSSRSYVPLVRTFGWSSMNHLISVEEYKRLLAFAEPGVTTGFMQYQGQQIKIKSKIQGQERPPTLENVLHQYLSFMYQSLRSKGGDPKKEHGNWGTYCYGFLQDSPYILHVDGSHKYISTTPAKYVEPF